MLSCVVFLSRLQDVPCAEMVCEKTEGRQMATACLLNYAPHLGLTDPTGSVSDVAVQVLNAVFEGLAAESDAVRHFLQIVCVVIQSAYGCVF